MTGDELRELRKAAGYMAKDIARELGYGQAQWSCFENGRRPIPPSVEYAARWVCQWVCPTVKEKEDEDQG